MPTEPVVAIGDIHGQIDMLHLALERIEAEGGPDAHVVFLGDYVDRGPDSRGVVELLSQGVASGATGRVFWAITIACFPCFWRITHVRTNSFVSPITGCMMRWAGQKRCALTVWNSTRAPARLRSTPPRERRCRRRIWTFSEHGRFFMKRRSCCLCMPVSAPVFRWKHRQKMIWSGSGRRS